MESLKKIQRNLFFTVLSLLFLSLISKADTLIITPDFVNFGEVEIGETAKKVLTIKNPTNKNIKIDNMKLSNNLNFTLNKWGGNNPCKWNRWLKPNQECTVVIRFTPFKKDKYEADFTVLTRDEDEILVELEGKGVKNSPNNPRLRVHPVRAIERTPNEYNFGKVFAGDRAVEVFVIANRSNGNLVFTKPIRVSDDEHFEVNPFGGNRPCRSYQPVLKKNWSCTIEVYFYPTKKKKYSTELKLNTNDPEHDELRYKLYGRGTYEAEPDIKIVKGMENFHDKEIGKESKFQIAIYNYGNDYLEINEMKLKTEDEVFKLDPKAGAKPCDTRNPIIEPHDYCTVYVRFIPKEEKKYETQMIIKSNDPDDKEIKITLKGKGIKKADIMDLNLKDEFTNGCSMELTPSIPFYLLIPLMIFLRRLKSNIKK